MTKVNRKFAGEWHIIELPDMGQGYLEEGDGKPYLRLKASDEDQVDGDYECGLCNGMIDGAVRNFGGDYVVIFGMEGMDEMDPVNKGGWLRLREDGLLEGEFVNHLGRFIAKPVKPKKKSAPKRGRGQRTSLR